MKPRVANLRILLVDDNALGLGARKSVLDELGYRTSTASSGVEALDLFRKNTYDLVVTDYRMPKMDGLELIGRMRGERPEVPIILVSGFADALGLNELNTGADVVIQKSANEVMHLVRAVARLSRRKAVKKPVASEISSKAKAARQSL
jgi:CheY-like chemotaxis protein